MRNTDIHADGREDYGIKLLRAVRGRRTRIAEKLGLTHQAVMSWPKVPIEYVFIVANFIKAKPEHLRPDFFKDDPLRRANALHQEHELVWKNREAYPTNKDAAAAVSTMVGHPVDPLTLTKWFGPSGRRVGRPGWLRR